MDGGDGDGFKRGRHERIDIRVGVERRRKWSRDDRLRIVQETLADGAVIAEVSKRNEVAPSLIYTWRKQALAGLLDGFHQVRIVPDVGLPPALDGPKRQTALNPMEVQAPASAPARGRIELTLHDGTVLRVDDDDSSNALRTILASLGSRS